MDTEVQNEGGGGAFIQILVAGLTRVNIPLLLLPFSPFFSHYFFQAGRENPAELKAQKLARSLTRGVVDRDLKPNRCEL